MGENFFHPLLDRHKTIFMNELGTVTTNKAALQVRPEALPKFYKPQTAPFAIKMPLEQSWIVLKAKGFWRSHTATGLHP